MPLSRHSQSKFSWAVILFLFKSLFFSTIALTDDVYEVVIKRQEKKKSAGWSLSDWLSTKEKIRAMDMWLALHSPSPYEFYLGGNLQFAQKDHGESYNGGQFHFAAFASIFGLEVQREQSNAKIINGLFHLRIFGYHNQTTNITLSGGLRSRGQDGEFRSTTAGVNTVLYLGRYFGLHGLYRHVFNSTPNNQGYRLAGDRFEAGALLDFKFLQIYGDYFHEQEFTSDSAFQKFHPIRSGILTGLRLFF